MLKGIRRRFVLIVMLGVCGFFALFSLALFELHAVLFDAYMGRSRSVVGVAVSLINQFERRYQSGELELATAQNLAKASLRALRFDGGAYLFIVDRDGRLVMHPTRPDLEGADLDHLAETAQTRLMELLGQAVRDGQGGGTYTFSAINGGKPRQKQSYIQLYPSWGWLIGTGLYVEDEEALFMDSAWRFATIALPMGLLLIYAIFRLSRSVSVPLTDLARSIDVIKARGSDHQVPHTERDDELGQLARAVAALRQVNQQEDAARRSRDLVAKVFDASREAVMITDPHGVIIQVSAALCRISGYDAQHLLGQNASILASGHHAADFFADLWRSLLLEGQWEGDIWNRHANGEISVVHQRLSVIRDDNGQVNCIVAIMHDMAERNHRQDGLRCLPLRDPLTNLAARSSLADKLTAALSVSRRTGRPLALVILDIDGFAHINDQIGQRNGDEVLRYMALRLMKLVRSNDVVARPGSDQYAILMTEIASEAEVAELAVRVVEAMRQPFVIAGRQLSLTVSVGIAMAPRDGMIGGTLSGAAQAAVERAIAAGGNGYAGVQWQAAALAVTG